MECPFNCMREERSALGMGIHPENSSICMSAIVDGASSFFGGLLIVSIQNGLSEYIGGTKRLLSN